MAAPASNPVPYDVTCYLDDGTRVLVHVPSRATPAGAVGPAMGRLTRAEHHQLESVFVEECAGHCGLVPPP